MEKTIKTDLSPIIITGPTASGKTKLAVHIAGQIDGEIISADSRQVYRGMDIGTGKDLSEYLLNGKIIPHHLIDICDAGEEYNLYAYQNDFAKIYREIIARGKRPILAGGTGLYIEAVLKDFHQTSVPVNEPLRNDLENETKEELEKYLRQINLQKLDFDTSTKKRIIRAIEIVKFLESSENSLIKGEGSEIAVPFEKAAIFCLSIPREILLQRINDRLIQRLQAGMIEEVEGLIRRGVSREKLKYYGLEYKFITQYLDGEFTREEMTEKLNIAIRQYAKRQMTWFRRMERNGFAIQWIDGRLCVDEQIRFVMEHI